MVILRRALLALAVAVACGGCPLDHGDYPDKSCKLSSDCFKGEVCSDNQCVPGAPADMALPVADQASAVQDLADVGDAE